MSKTPREEGVSPEKDSSPSKKDFTPQAGDRDSEPGWSKYTGEWFLRGDKAY